MHKYNTIQLMPYCLECLEGDNSILSSVVPNLAEVSVNLCAITKGFRLHQIVCFRNWFLNNKANRQTTDSLLGEWMHNGASLIFVILLEKQQVRRYTFQNVG